MADPPRPPDGNRNTGDDSRVGSGRESTASPPRWVKVFGTIAAVLVLLFVIMHLIGGGPGGHARP